MSKCGHKVENSFKIFTCERESYEGYWFVEKFASNFSIYVCACIYTHIYKYTSIHIDTHTYTYTYKLWGCKDWDYLNHILVILITGKGGAQGTVGGIWIANEEYGLYCSGSQVVCRLGTYSCLGNISFRDPEGREMQSVLLQALWAASMHAQVWELPSNTTRQKHEWVGTMQLGLCAWWVEVKRLSHLIGHMSLVKKEIVSNDSERRDVLDKFWRQKEVFHSGNGLRKVMQYNVLGGDWNSFQGYHYLWGSHAPMCELFSTEVKFSRQYGEPRYHSLLM